MVMAPPLNILENKLRITQGDLPVLITSVKFGGTSPYVILLIYFPSTLSKCYALFRPLPSSRLSLQGFSLRQLVKYVPVEVHVYHRLWWLLKRRRSANGRWRRPTEKRAQKQQDNRKGKKQAQLNGVTMEELFVLGWCARPSTQKLPIVITLSTAFLIDLTLSKNYLLIT